MTRRGPRPRLVFFDGWMDPAAEDHLAADEEIALVRLEQRQPHERSWTELASAHGYQVLPRTELQDPWFGDTRLLGRCPRMLALASTGAGYDYIDVDACTEAGVIVCHQGGTNREAVAEHALALVLALSKRLLAADRAVREGRAAERFSLGGNDIAGKTLGIVGLGSIGSRLAELCQGLFGMRVLAYDPYLDPVTVRRRCAEQTSLSDLLARADVVSVHCPRTTETWGMLGAEQFALMKESAFFVTTARGGVHDEEALAAALREGRIAGAGLDVFASEPPPADHPLLALDSVIVTPHVAGGTAEALLSMAMGAARQWSAVLRGRVPDRLVNPEAWPLYSRRFEELLGFAPDPL